MEGCNILRDLQTAEGSGGAGGGLGLKVIGKNMTNHRLLLLVDCTTSDNE